MVSIRLGVPIRLSVLGPLAVLIAACAPVTNPAPIPTTTTTRAAVLCPIDASTNAYAAYVDTPSGESEVVTFTANTPAAVDAKVAQLEVAGDVVAVGPDRVVSALAVVDPTDDDFYYKQWGNVGTIEGVGATPVGYAPTKTQFEAAWETQNGIGITVAVIDTGVQADHPDLAGRVSSERQDFVTNPEGELGRATDLHGHGTHVAGIIAAADNDTGVVGGAPQSTILAVRVLDSSGNGFISAVARGVDWAVANEAKVINLSLGSTSNSPVLEAAVNNAVAEGVVVVAAAGNNPTCLVSSYPGAYPQAISVGAIKESGAIADYSNRDASVDIAAPGTNILSTLTTHAYGPKSGTSMATPVVAASVALLLQKCLALDPPVPLAPAAVRTRLRATMSAPVPGFAAAPYEVGVVQPGTLVAADCPI